VALQQTTRQLWASQGPFEPYTVHGVPQQNVPEDYIKAVVWKTDIVPNRYYAQSSAPEESGIPAWYPVEFNPEHICWVEVCWAEPAGSEGYWQAFRIAGEDLGLDITQEEVEGHIERILGINNYRESRTSSPTTRVSTPSEPSIISVTVSPSPQSKEDENDKLQELRRYARDFRRQHTTDAERFNWDSDDEDYGLAIGRLVVT
jgi:hypothetical protein